MSNKEDKKPGVKELSIEERVAALENATNALIMYVNTLEKWRHMDFKPPAKEEGEADDGSSKPEETQKEDSGKETAK